VASPEARVAPAEGGCAVEDAEFRDEENLLSHTPFELVLSCRGGSRETFLVSHSWSTPGASGHGYLSVAAADDGARRDLSRTSRLLNDVIVGDLWADPIMTFNAGNAVGRTAEMFIIAFVIAALGGGLAFLFLARPDAGSQ
jgi:hypothetical protein